MLSRRLLILLVAFFFAAAGASGYFYFRTQITNFIDRLTGAGRLAHLFLCPGETFVNRRQGYELCYPKDWFTREFGYSQLVVGFDQFPIPQGEYHGVFLVSVSNETEATLLAQDLSTLENPITNATAVGGTTGIQVAGVLPAGNKFFPQYREIFTIFEDLGRTYAIQMLSAPDLYEANFSHYSDLLASFRFLERTVSPPWGKDIYLTNPWPGDKVSCSFHIAGSVKNAFGNKLTGRLKTAEGTVLVESGVAVNAPGMGELGYFDQTVNYQTTSSAGTLEVFYTSPKDGSIVDLVSVPLTLGNCPL